MNKLGLIVIITKHNEVIHKTYSVDSIDSAKTELIKCLFEQFQYINIDFPYDYQKFEYLWFGDNYMKTDVFTYQIFSNNEWIKQPWDLEDIYSDIIDKIHQFDIDNCDKYTNIYEDNDNNE
jgi:hypothetical protein